MSREITSVVELLQGRKTVVLTGAGCSTESGIPDYRGPETRNRARNPIQYRQFLRDPTARQRYWARSFTGWPRFRQARPNRAHALLARLEAEGLVNGIITQNVDRLHHVAGSRRVVELHGALAEVTCLECGALLERDTLQHELAALNPDWNAESLDIAPDGDVEIGSPYERFRVSSCDRCRGPLKPRVVFFGESVPKPVVRDAFALFDEAEALLIVGSSLAVFSGYRFLLRARDQGKPAAMINLGLPERGVDLLDAYADISASLGLERLAGPSSQRLT